MIKVGERYGMLKVLKSSARTNSGRLQFECLCDCGNTTIAESSNIERGRTSSCGCYRTQSRYRHNMVNSSEYQSWCALRVRCYNKKSDHYKDYGGRGIKVCDSWLESFNNFFDDMGYKPNRRYSIDRINNDGDYTPSNCRWAKKKIQARNKRNNHILSYNGESHPITEWEEKLGFKQGTVKSRIYYGWDIERALTEPVRKTKRWYNET